MRKSEFILSLFIGLIIFSSKPSSAGIPTTPASFDTINAQLNEFRGLGDYLSPIGLLQDQISQGDLQRTMWAQNLAFFYSFVGEYDSAVKVFNSAFEPPQIPLPDEKSERQFLSSVSVQPAAEAICRAAAFHQIVIINEAHHYPQDRAFGRKLLRCFKENGFHQIAVEAIDEDSASINKRGRVSYQASGYYTVEPQMAGFIDDALNLGMKAIAYDGAPPCPNCSSEDLTDAREQFETDNLMSQVFNNDPTAKLLIWVGYSHAYKRQLDDSPKSRWMAARLWERTGIEPYSIEQLSDTMDRNPLQPAFISINKVMLDNNPVFVDIASNWDKIPKAYQPSLRKTEMAGPPAIDAIVVHHEQSADSSKALWLESEESQILKAKLTCYKCTRTEKVLMQIFPVNADLNDTVPVDQSLISADGHCQLIAPEGEYNVRIWSGAKVVYTGVRRLRRHNRLSI